MKIKPNPNKTVNSKPLVVVDIAHGDALPTEGREVHRNAYWVRRLEVGDVVLCEDEVKAKTKSKSKSNKKGA